MHAVLFFPNSGLRGIPTIVAPASTKSTIYGNEIADGALCFAYQGSFLQPTWVSIRSEVNRRGRARRNISSDRPAKEADKLKDLPTSDNETSRPSSQEEIIALFRRIQSSISKGGSSASKRRSPSNLKEKQSAESVLGALRRYPRRKQTRVPSLEEYKESPRSSGLLEGKAPRDAKVSRPMSNFVKRSPIPPPSSTPPSSSMEEITKEAVEEQLPEIAADEVLELQKINGMKLTELKEVARRKGVKGYSKLKKGELLELLKRVLQSSS